MAVTLARFKNTFSTFRKTDDAEIEVKLLLAHEMVNAGMFGTKRDIGILYLTAHLVSLDPAGQNAKMKPENMAKTVYGQTYEKIKRGVTFGFRTAGVAPAGAVNEPIT